MISKIPPELGSNDSSLISSLNVDNSSCAIQEDRINQRHWQQYIICILFITLGPFEYIVCCLLA
jgi:hypothetical protein